MVACSTEAHATTKTQSLNIATHSAHMLTKIRTTEQWALRLLRWFNANTTQLVGRPSFILARDKRLSITAAAHF